MCVVRHLRTRHWLAAPSAPWQSAAPAGLQITKRQGQLGTCSRRKTNRACQGEDSRSADMENRGIHQNFVWAAAAALAAAADRLADESAIFGIIACRASKPLCSRSRRDSSWEPALHCLSTKRKLTGVEGFCAHYLLLDTPPAVPAARCGRGRQQKQNASHSCCQQEQPLRLRHCWTSRKHCDKHTSHAIGAIVCSQGLGGCARLAAAWPPALNYPGLSQRALGTW